MFPPLTDSAKAFLFYGIAFGLTWLGRWRWAALVPVVIVLGLVRRIVLEVRADPTSHNLWPFEVLATVIAAAALLGVLELIRAGAARFGWGGHAERSHLSTPIGTFTRGYSFGSLHLHHLSTRVGTAAGMARMRHD